MSEPRERPSIVGAALAVADLLRRRERGEAVDLTAFFAQHPELSADLLDELRAALEDGGVSDPAPFVRRARAEPTESAVLELLGHLARSEPGRYERRAYVGEGGMGVVYDVWDPVLRRSLARKELRAVASRDRALGPRELRGLRRFVEEAQVTAQLDHPGVVPVHELGLDPNGRVYFTMKLVRGDDLRAVYRRVASGEGGWNLTRAVGVLQRVCETVAFAHERGVVHRDLKPANVMVGRFGETYVMDWGLASIRGKPQMGSRTRVDTVVNDSDVADLLRTREGDVVGTLLYLAPEQARGAQAEVGAPSDVYAVGVMLYELLAGHAPYAPSGVSREPERILACILEGPPARLDPRCGPAELIAICEKAMARAPRDRFATMGQLAEELRAYLENRVVKVHQTGAVAELRKWVARNRPTAAALAGLLLVLLIGAGLVAWKEQQRADEAGRRQVLAAEKADAELRRGDIELAQRLVRSTGELGAIHPDGVAGYERWLADAADLETRFASYRAELDELRRTSGRRSEGPVPAPALREELEKVQYYLASAETVLARADEVLASGDAGDEERRRAREDLRVLQSFQDERRVLLEKLAYELERARPWTFADESTQRRHDELAAHVVRLDDLFHERFGLRQCVEADLARAESLYRDSVARYRDEWRAATESIADLAACPAYRGTRIVPQLGLVPLGRNPESGLWEFWHVLSGERPQRDARGRWAMDGATGMVLVLIPGGDTWIGAQVESATESRFDPTAHVHERPPHRVALAPYFISKFELTQGQWMRGGRQNPSEYRAGDHYRGAGAIARSHPVEHVSWTEAHRFLERWGLTLPTESQWEHAARAGTDTVFWTGDDASGLRDVANIAGGESGAFPRALPPETEHRDPHVIHAPVGSFRPNPWGLHDVHGNVAEWCLDWAVNNYRDFVLRPGSGEHLAAEGRRRSVRGGSFESVAFQVRCAGRDKKSPEHRSREIGVRACRTLESTPWTPGGDR